MAQKQQRVISSFHAAVKDWLPNLQSPSYPQTLVWMGTGSQGSPALAACPGHLPSLENTILPLLLVHKHRDFSGWLSFPEQKLESSGLWSTS